MAGRQFFCKWVFLGHSSVSINIYIFPEEFKINQRPVDCLSQPFYVVGAVNNYNSHSGKRNQAMGKLG